MPVNGNLIKHLITITMAPAIGPYANDVIKANYSVKSGQVTKIMVDEVQKYLDEMTYANSLNEFNSYLLEIFKMLSITKLSSGINGSVESNFFAVFLEISITSSFSNMPNELASFN